MIGILIVIALTVAVPIGILYLVVKATERERSAPSIGRRVSAFCFGAASLLGLIAIEVSISGLKNFHGILLLAGIPIMVTAALLAFILHRRIFTSSKTTAALGGGGHSVDCVRTAAGAVWLFCAVQPVGLLDGDHAQAAARRPGNPLLNRSARTCPKVATATFLFVHGQENPIKPDKFDIKSN